MFILPYKKGSKSAKDLAQSLNVKRLKLNKEINLRRSTVLNWGNSYKTINAPKVLNKSEYVRNAINKLKTFQILEEKGIAISEFTTSFEKALTWINDECIVMARSLLESHSGKGIVVCKTTEELAAVKQQTKLYVKYFAKKYEFRVHVFNGKVIDYIQKKRRSEIVEMIDSKYVRSWNNGWVFCRNDIIVKEEVKTLAIEAVKALGLDFGAVDVIMKTNGEIKILEINTAPALQNTTLKLYTKAIKDFLNEHAD